MRPDVELVEPRVELLTIFLDVTLPALFQQSTESRAGVCKGVRKAKAKDGRLLNSSQCLSFIVTSMGGLLRRPRISPGVQEKNN